LQLIDSPADDPVHFQQLVDRHVFNAHGLQAPACLSGWRGSTRDLSDLSANRNFQSFGGKSATWLAGCWLMLCSTSTR
jgi:hypothetical protein